MSEGAPFLGVGPYQWLAALTALLVPLLLADAWVGHARTRFRHAVQYLPFVFGLALLAGTVLLAALPEMAWARLALWWSAWLTIAAGLFGLLAHHVFGVRRQPGGYTLLLHHLMYGAPPLAPLGLVFAALFALVALLGVQGVPALGGLRLPAALLVMAALALLAAAAQAGVYHFRGAFAHAAMYVPVTVPPLAAVAALWGALAPAPWLRVVAGTLLWVTFLAGFVGLGMHLRGFERRPGGLFLWRATVHDGPAVAAPAVLTVVAAVGLVAVHLLGAIERVEAGTGEPRLFLPGGAPPAEGHPIVPPGSPEFPQAPDAVPDGGDAP